MNETNGELNKTKEEVQEIQESLIEIRKLYDKGEFVEAQKLLRKFLKENIDFQTELNRLKEEDISKTEKLFGLIKSALENDGNVRKVLIDQVVDPKNIDKLRELLLDGAEQMGLNVENEVNYFFNSLNGAIEGDIGLIEKNFNRAVNPIYETYKDVKALLEGKNPIMDMIEEDTTKGYNRYSKGKKEDLGKLEKILSDVVIVEEKIENQLSSIDESAIDRRKKYFEEEKACIEAEKARKEEEERFVSEYVERYAKMQNDQYDKKFAREDAAIKFEKELRDREVQGIQTREAIQVQAINKDKVLQQQRKDIQQEGQATQLESVKSNNQATEQAEASSHKTRLSQWQQYAQNVSTISKQVSEVSGMVANSVGGMFNQLAQSYAQEVGFQLFLFTLYFSVYALPS